MICLLTDVWANPHAVTVIHTAGEREGRWTATVVVGGERHCASYVPQDAWHTTRGERVDDPVSAAAARASSWVEVLASAGVVLVQLSEHLWVNPHAVSTVTAYTTGVGHPWRAEVCVAGQLFTELYVDPALTMSYHPGTRTGDPDGAARARAGVWRDLIGAALGENPGYGAQAARVAAAPVAATASAAGTSEPFVDAGSLFPSA